MNIPHKEPTLSGDVLEGEGTFFRTHSITVQESLTKEAFKNFCNLTTDEDRIKFVYDLDVIHKIDLPVSPFSKNVQNAQLLKNQGNNYFGQNSYERSAKLYSHALIECPDTEDVLLATLFANRSASFYHIKDYDRSLQDINLAENLPYPVHLQHKIQDRKARCYLALNDLVSAVAAFKIAMACLEKSKLDSQTRMKKESDIAIMIAMLTNTLKNPNLPDNTHVVKVNRNLPIVPKLARGKNELYPVASSLVKIENKEVEGRFGIANGDIEAGEVLFIEKAHSSNLLCEYSKSHCQECFVRVPYPVPCPKCPNVVFCSVKCRNVALATYHKYECAFVGSLWTSGSSIICNLALRIITQKGLKYFVNIKPKLSQKLSDTEIYDYSSYRTIYNLCRHAEKRTYVDFFQRSVMAVVLLRFLQQAQFFGGESSRTLTENEIYIGGLLLTNLQMIQFNAHEIAELQFDSDYPGELDKAKSQFIGGGVFPSLALLNHSCDPGIVRYFSGSKVIVKAVRHIQSGREIGENYGPIYTQVTRDIRRAELKSRYWFDCNCIPCTEDWPLFRDMKTDALPFRCIKSRTCPGTVPIPLTTDEFMFPCPECKEMICIFGGLKSLNDTEELFKKGECLLKSQNYEEGLRIFLKIMKILDNVLRAPFKDFCLCQQKIRSSMLTFGNVHQLSGVTKK